MMGVFADQLDVLGIQLHHCLFVLHVCTLNAQTLGLLTQSNQLVSIFFFEEHGNPGYAVASVIRPVLQLTKGFRAI